MGITSNTNIWNNIDTDPGNANEFDTGAGAVGFNSEIYLEGGGSLGKRVDNGTRAFAVGTAGNFDLSGNRQHVGLFFGSITWGLISDVGVVLVDSGGGNPYEAHLVIDTAGGVVSDGSENDKPLGGGFVPLWLDTSRTPDNTGNYSGGSAITPNSVQFIGAIATCGNLGGGNLQNCYIDAVKYTPAFTDNANGNAALPAIYTITGATGNTIEDLRAREAGSSGYRGLLSFLDGADFFFGRLAIGRTGNNSNSIIQTTFSESDKTFIFVSQRTMADYWLGWDVTCSTSSGGTTNTFSLTNCNFQSSDVTSATRRPSLNFYTQPTGSTPVGSQTITDCALLGLREIRVLSTTTITGGSLDTVSYVENSAGEVNGVNVTSRAANGTAMGTNLTFGSSTGFHDCTIKPSVATGGGHFVEFTTDDTAFGSARTFTNLTFEDSYAGSTTGTITAAGSNDACVHNSSGGTVTLNISGGTVPTIRNSNGSTTIVNQSFTITVTGLLGNSEVRLYDNPSLFTGGGSSTESTTPAGVETVAAVTQTNTGSNYIFYSVDLGLNVTQIQRILGGVDFTTLGLVSGDKIRVTVRDNTDNPTLQLFDEFEVDGTVTVNTIPIVDVAASSTNFSTLLSGTNTKTVTVEKVNASTSFTATAGTYDIFVYRTGSLPIITKAISVNSTDGNASIPISQTGDRVYKNPA